MALTKSSSGEVDAPISFTTTGFTLMPAGGCGSVTSGCGHVHLYVDPSPDGGASPCTPAGAPYNNATPLAAGQGSPVNAIISSCASSDPADGPHTVLLELHSDQHAPIDDANGKTISQTVSFTATGP